MIRIITHTLIAFLVISMNVFADPTRVALSSAQTEFRSLDEQVQEIKEEVIKINRELMLLQEKILYPSNTQVAIFVSMESTPKFSLDTIELKLDNKVVQKHRYSFRELEALRKSGVQRLHTGNLTNGKHSLSVTITGHTASNRIYKRNAGFSLNKATGPKLVELRVVDTNGNKPSVELKEWEQ